MWLENGGMHKKQLEKFKFWYLEKIWKKFISVDTKTASLDLVKQWSFERVSRSIYSNMLKQVDLNEQSFKELDLLN